MARCWRWSTPWCWLTKTDVGPVGRRQWRMGLGLSWQWVVDERNTQTTRDGRWQRTTRERGYMQHEMRMIQDIAVLLSLINKSIKRKLIMNNSDSWQSFDSISRKNKPAQMSAFMSINWKYFIIGFFIRHDLIVAQAADFFFIEQILFCLCLHFRGCDQQIGGIFVWKNIQLINYQNSC